MEPLDDAHAPDTATVDDASDSDAADADAALPVDGSVAAYAYDGFEGTACDIAGSTTSFTVRLTSAPTASVTIPVGVVGAPATVSPFSIAFTPEDWSEPQRITVTASGADVASDTTLTVLLGMPTTIDPFYATTDPEDVSLTLCDHGSDALLVRAVGGGALTLPLETDKSGEQTSFEVVLAAAPSADVRVALTTSVDAEVMLSATELVFDATTWSTPQVVTLIGLADAAPTMITSLLLTLTPTSDDAGYAAQPAAILPVRNRELRTNVALFRSVSIETCAGFCPLFYSASEIVDGVADQAPALVSANAWPTFVIDLGKVYVNPIITVNCAEGPFTAGSFSGNLPRPSLSVSTTAGTAQATSVPYTVLTPTRVPRGVRYVRLEGTTLSGAIRAVACTQVVVMGHPLD